MKMLSTHWLSLRTAVQTAVAQMARSGQRKHAMYAISLATGACVPGLSEATAGDMGTGSRAVMLAYECRTCKEKVLNGEGGK